MKTTITTALTSLMLLVCMPTSVQAADGSGGDGGGGFIEWVSSVVSWLLRGGESESQEGTTEINNGEPVPTIDEGSGDFLVRRIAEDADQLHGQESTEAQHTYGSYADKLAKTLSQLNAHEQQIVFYGRR